MSFLYFKSVTSLVIPIKLKFFNTVCSCMLQNSNMIGSFHQAPPSFLGINSSPSWFPLKRQCLLSRLPACLFSSDLLYMLLVLLKFLCSDCFERLNIADFQVFAKCHFLLETHKNLLDQIRSSPLALMILFALLFLSFLNILCFSNSVIVLFMYFQRPWYM